MEKCFKLFYSKVNMRMIFGLAIKKKQKDLSAGAGNKDYLFPLFL